MPSCTFGCALAHIIVNENRSVKRFIHFIYMVYLTGKIHFELVICLHVSVGQYHILARMLDSMTFKIFEIKFLRYCVVMVVIA